MREKPQWWRTFVLFQRTRVQFSAPTSCTSQCSLLQLRDGYSSSLLASVGRSIHMAYIHTYTQKWGMIMNYSYVAKHLKKKGVLWTWLASGGLFIPSDFISSKLLHWVSNPRTGMNEWNWSWRKAFKETIKMKWDQGVSSRPKGQVWM